MRGAVPAGMADGLDRARLMERVRMARSVAASLRGAAARAIMRSRARVAHALVISSKHRALWGCPSPPCDAPDDGVPPLPASPPQRGA